MLMMLAMLPPLGLRGHLEHHAPGTATTAPSEHDLVASVLVSRSIAYDISEGNDSKEANDITKFYCTYQYLAYKPRS